MVGDGNFDQVSERGTTALVTLYLIYLLVGGVLLLNLLIAAMSHSYEVVVQNAHSEWLCDYATNIVRIERSLPARQRRAIRSSGDEDTIIMQVSQRILTDKERREEYETQRREALGRLIHLQRGSSDELSNLYSSSPSSSSPSSPRYVRGYGGGGGERR